MIRVNGAHTRPRVLVAEDDRSVRESLVLALELEGYEVEAVGDGEKALAAFAASEPDVVLLDVMMPFVDGLTVCRRLRARGTRLVSNKHFIPTIHIMLTICAASEWQ